MTVNKISYVNCRPETTVLDCTLRDGGLINNHMFEDHLAQSVYSACIEAGVDYIELGYKADTKIFASDKYGHWKYCKEEDILRIIEKVDNSEKKIKLSVMADAEKTQYKRDILPADKSPLDLIRVATYIHQVPTAIDMVKDAKDKGYEVTLNLMAMSTARDRELDEALEVFAGTDADAVIIVDSYGCLFPEQIRRYTKRYLNAVKGTKKQVGIHAHNNQQLAFANTIEAFMNGAERLDATLNGIGRGAGNCPMELLLGFLKNPKFNIRPIIECIEQQLVPLKEGMEWGYSIPYAITALFNQHPRSAIQLRDSDQKDNYTEFYDRWNEA